MEKLERKVEGAEVNGNKIHSNLECPLVYGSPKEVRLEKGITYLICGPNCKPH